MANQSNTGNTPLVTALFRDRESAECAYRAISSRGYDKDDVNVMMSDETRQKYYAEGSDAGNTELGSKALEGTGAGAGIGGTVGAIIGAIVAIGTSVAIPGLGLIIAGPIAGALVGAGAGGLTGGIIGALVGSGIPEETAQEYETGIKSGGTVLGVSPRSGEDAAFFEREWRNCGGVNVYSSGGYTDETVSSTNQTGYRANSTTTSDQNLAPASVDTAYKNEANTTTAKPSYRANSVTPSNQNFASMGTEAENVNQTANTGEVVIPVIEEQLQVGKQEVEKGGAKIRTHVEEKPVEETVNLRQEHLRVERHPVNRPVSETDIGAFEEGTIEVLERAEQPVVSKQAQVVEEISIGKEVEERSETVRDTVRKTEVDVERLEGDVDFDNQTRTRTANS